MNRTSFVILCIFVLVLVCSCGGRKSYKIGDTGPAGGIIFYDCDADNDSGNQDGLKSEKCGWRYLEAAPSDLHIGSENEFAFGYYRTSDSGSNLYANGTTKYEEGSDKANDGKCTGTAIGTGKANTEKLIQNMGTTAYRSSSGSSKTSNYAAKVVSEYTFGGYDDWFLPSQDEVILIYDKIYASESGTFESGHYWTSSEVEYDNEAYAAISVFFTDHAFLSTPTRTNRYNQMGIRCVRSF